MKNFGTYTLIILLFFGIFFLGRWTKQCDPVKIVPKYVHIVRYDTIHDTADRKPIHLPIPISRYLFTDDSTYRMEVEGYNVKANSIEVYPRTVTQTVIQRVEVPGKPKRWGIGVSAGAALTPQGIRPYLGVGMQYNLVVF